jgi:plastocyanin
VRLSGTIVAVVCAAIASSQCGGGSAAKNTVSESVTPMPNNVTVNSQVRVAEYKFSPETVYVAVGQVVRWTNEDNVKHNVRFVAADTAARQITSRAELLAVGRPKELYASKLFDQGESWTAKFDKPGRFAYVCDPHPYMRAVIVVK